jgi:hypothetical protein
MISVSDVVAIIALALSGYALWTTSNFNNRQLKLIESQEKLNARLLAEGETEALEKSKADVGASLVKLGSSKHRVKVFNKGKAPARNVRIEFPDGNNMVPGSEISDKFPMEVLEQHQAVELMAAVHMQTPRKQTVILRWEDEHSDANEKVVYLTL